MAKKMYRNSISPALPLATLYVCQIFVLAMGQYKVIGERDKVLFGHSFLNLTKMSIERCLAKCLENCLCLSFQLCDANECQLCSSNKEVSPFAFGSKNGCTSFVFKKDVTKSSRNQQCYQNCLADTTCCLTSNPCLNGGTCAPVASTDSTTRFKCNCPVGYTGNRCQDPIKSCPSYVNGSRVFRYSNPCLNGGTCEPDHPTNREVRFKCRCPDGYTGNRCQDPIKSCRNYINGSRRPGIYKVFNDRMRLHKVFCDFDLNSTMAWTLIQSYGIENVNEFRESFFVNRPTNTNSPSWKRYRLSKFKMESIQHDSCKWRVTCQYDTDGVVYTDYVRGDNSKIDILTFNDEQCIEVEYIDIRGKNCSNCTAFFLQGHIYNNTGNRYPLHISSSRANYCSFQQDSIACVSSGRKEHNFGYYSCQNKEHRCSATNTSTTQTWFGGV